MANEAEAQSHAKPVMERRLIGVILIAAAWSILTMIGAVVVWEHLIEFVARTVATFNGV